jgi:NAD(P)-dependent dehydrogenase (short-subunit alcohol dehydrogenase family)
MKQMAGFDGKLAFITGGSSGIGLAAAELLAREGAGVVIFARGLKRLEEAAGRIEAARKSAQRPVGFRQLDVTDHRQVKQVMEEAVAEYGPPDLLVNCAGRAYPNYFENITWEQFDETMKVHMYGIWNTVSALVPHMKERGGWIANTTSLLGFLGVFGYTDYCASKFAIIGFSEALRSELKRHGIGVSVLCPPDTDTPGFAVENLTKPPETVAVSEGGGLMRPEEVAAVLLKGIRKGRFHILPGNARTVYYLKRFMPWLVDLVMDRQIRRARLEHQRG